jgi:phosphatidylethanolamine/phosphatidyl-N-methylethanolamine N-methyltransferase
MSTRLRETLYFIGSMLRHPRRIGAVAPSSRSLARLMSRGVELRPGGIVLEIGAGTGVVTEALLDAGVPPEKLFVVELDQRLHEYLTLRFPGVTVLHGDAATVDNLLPAEYVGKVSTVVSSLPVRAMSFDLQRRIVEATFKSLEPSGVFIQFTYPPLSPLPTKELGLAAEKRGRIWLNLPPAAVWHFRRRPTQAMA